MTQTRKDLYNLWLPTALCLLLLLIQVYFLLKDFGSFDFDGLQAPRNGSTLAVLKSVDREVRHRFGGTLLWNTPGADTALLQNDAIATMSGAMATLVFPDQSELVLEPDTLIVLEEAPSKTSEGRIVARLVRGSVTRKKSGKAPLFIKLSGEADAPLRRFDDQKGDAVFRLVVRAHGVEVTVESGSVTVDQKAVLTPGKLKAPQLKKPKIDILPSQSWWDRLTLFPEAQAADTQKVNIQFEWEEIEGAQSYDLQISTQPQFDSVLLEKRIEGTQYRHQAETKTAQELYFRVAGVDSSGQRGEFSATEKVTIQNILPENPIRTKPLPALPRTPPAAATPALKSSTAVAPPLLPVKKFAGYWVLSPAYHSRTFLGTPGVTEFSGSGFVPLSLQGELTFFERVSLGGLYFPEKATPQNAGSQTAVLSIPWIRGWLITPFPFWKKLGLGASLSLSHSFLWTAAELESSIHFLPGVAARLQILSWLQLQGSRIPSSASGGWETLGFATYPLTFKKIDGLFLQITATGRWIKIERSYSGSLGVGYAL